MKSNPKSAAGAASGAPAQLPDALDAAWRDYFERAREMPAHTQARDFLHRDLTETFARIIPADASVHGVALDHTLERSPV